MRQLFPYEAMAFLFYAFSSGVWCYYDYLLLAPQVALVKVCLQDFLVQLLRKLLESMVHVWGFLVPPAEDGTCLRSENFQRLKRQILANKLYYFCKVNNLSNGWHVLCHGVQEINSSRCAAVSQPPAAASFMLHTQKAWKVFLVTGKVDFGVFQASGTRIKASVLLIVLLQKLFGLSLFLNWMVTLDSKQH